MLLWIVPGHNQPLVKKRTRLRGTPQVLKHCTKKCPGTHTHRYVVEGFKISGKWMNVSIFSGGYTKQFANAVLDGAEAYLEEGPEPEVLVEGRLKRNSLRMRPGQKMKCMCLRRPQQQVSSCTVCTNVLVIQQTRH